mmetsp:Transcript_16076/g.23772  ORF Transcript_16076/g.23772 Transcript_16076/m.23772 type:complete len:142 (-) Transcript_16076:9-434(-)
MMLNSPSSDAAPPHADASIEGVSALALDGTLLSSSNSDWKIFAPYVTVEGASPFDAASHGNGRRARFIRDRQENRCLESEGILSEESLTDGRTASLDLLPDILTKMHGDVNRLARRNWHLERQSEAFDENLISLNKHRYQY